MGGGGGRIMMNRQMNILKENAYSKLEEREMEHHWMIDLFKREINE